MEPVPSIVFISGPYRARTCFGVLLNILRARRVAYRYWRDGHIVICPHANSAFMDRACSDELWLDAYLTLLRHCGSIVMMRNWEQSTGAIAERDAAIRAGIRVIYD